MYGGNAGTSGVAANAAVALGFYNADKLGRSLVVWHLEGQFKPGTSGVPFMTFFFQIITGTNGWTPSAANPLMGGTAGAFGQVVDAYALNWPTTNTYYAAYTGNFHWEWPHEWPLAVVKPGDCFFCYSDPSFTGGGANAILISGMFEAAPTAVAQ